MVPEHNPAQQELLRFLDALLNKGGTKRVAFVEAGLPPMAGAYLHPYCRMHLVAAGQLPMDCTQGQQVVTVRQTAGCGSFHPPRAWNVVRYPSTHSVFGISFQDSFTRFLWMGYRRRSGRPSGPDVWYHTGRPLPPPGREVLHALTTLVEGGGDQQTAQLLFNALLRLAREELATDEPSRANKATQTFEYACAYIQENAHLAITRDTIAQALRVHPNYLSRLFRERGNQTLVHYIQSLRLDRAVALLRDPQLTVGEAAAQAGFCDPAHFFKLFRQAHGMSPGSYRRRQTSQADSEGR